MGKKGKGNKRLGDDDEEEDDKSKVKSSSSSNSNLQQDGATPQQLSGTAARKAKREAKKAQKGGSNNKHMTEDHESENEEENDEDHKKASTKTVRMDVPSDSEEDEKKPKKPIKATPKKPAFAALVSDDDDDDDDDNEKDMKKPSSSFNALITSDDDDEEAEEDDDNKERKKKTSSSKQNDEKKQSSSKKESKSEKSSKKGGGEEEEEEEEDNDNDNTPQIKSKGDKPVKEKKLSNKERRKIKMESEMVSLESSVNSMSVAGGKKTEFAVSHTPVDRKSENWLNATDIHIPQLTISAYGKTLFEDAELKISTGRRYGLVGPNGMGKTTILKQIANGELPIPPKFDCLYVEQEVTADDTPAIDMVLAADTVRTDLLRREKEVLAKIDAGEYSDEIENEMREVSEALRASGADGAEARALALLHGLGFTEQMQRAPTKSFSGGWRMRVSLARALFMQPTLLLLDEPTNHLDLGAVIWLDDYLQKWKNTLLVVSHDQDFLDSVCTDIIHLENKKLVYYRGNYETFHNQWTTRCEKLLKAYEKEQKALQALKSSGKATKSAKEAHLKKNDRESGGAKKKKPDGGEAAHGSSSSSSNASTLQGARGEDGLLIKPKEYEVKFEFPSPPEISPPIIQVRDISFKYPGENAPVLFKDLSFGIDMKSRITIVGPNGVGKSTLLKLIGQEIVPTEGDVMINQRLRIARYHQHFVDVLPMNETPVEYLCRVYNQQQLDVRSKLGRFGLPGPAHVIKMMNLSGGQKARVLFASIAFQNAHILILDEPTNNLDLESIDALIDAINNFSGGVVLVSHDARLITSTDMILWVCDKQTVEEMVGGFPAYRQEILDDIEKREKETKKRQAERQAERDAIRAKKLEEMESRKKKNPVS